MGLRGELKTVSVIVEVIDEEQKWLLDFFWGVDFWGCRGFEGRGELRLLEH